MDEHRRHVPDERSVPAGAPGPATSSDLSPPASGGVSLQGVRLLQAVDEVVVPASNQHLILMNIGRPYRLEETLDGRVVQTSGLRGDIAVIPAGHEAAFRTRERMPQRVESVVMLLDPSVIAGLATAGDLDADRIELVGMLGAREPAIERVGMAVLAELDGGGLLGELYIELLATALGVHLLRNHSSLGQAVARVTEPTGGLSRTQVQRVVDYVEANLDGRLTLEELAAVAGLSPFHFSRLFKRATGLSPHRYVIERRVERAKTLLASTDLPLHEVAARAGFADQSHLARQTRRLLGVTPTALRRR